MKLNTDVLIVGAGITGCSVARELSRYNCSVTVIDRENDIAEGATKANSGIVHAGYDAVSGSRKASRAFAGSLSSSFSAGWYRHSLAMEDESMYVGISRYFSLAAA